MTAMTNMIWKSLTNFYLDLKILSQRLQGIEMPSRCFTSICPVIFLFFGKRFWLNLFLIYLPLITISLPSFPQALHLRANPRPSILFLLFSIKDFTFEWDTKKIKVIQILHVWHHPILKIQRVHGIFCLKSYWSPFHNWSFRRGIFFNAS